MPVRASSKGCTIRRVEIPSNKLLTTAFEASLECIIGKRCPAPVPVPSKKHIGSYRGFELEGYINVVTAEIQISMNGKLAHPFDLSSVPALNLTRLDSVLQKLPKQIELEKGKCDALLQQEADAKKQLGAAFPQEEELKEKVARLEKLSRELDIDSSKEPISNTEQKLKIKSQGVQNAKAVLISRLRGSCLRSNEEMQEEEWER